MEAQVIRLDDYRMSRYVPTKCESHEETEVVGLSPLGATMTFIFLSIACTIAAQRFFFPR